MAMPLFGAASLFLQGVSAQEICACSPSGYTFTLDFSLSCPPVNVTRNGGISATFCQVSPFGDEFHNITDLVPAEVMYVDVLELGQAFEVLSQQNITGSFMDGDQFDYTSIVEEEDNLEIPKVIQLNIFAQNAAGEAIVNFFAISYSNACDEYPSLVEGESAGWTHFTSLEPPSIENCPAALVPTETPATDQPTAAPVAVATDPPTTAAPVAVATDDPTPGSTASDPTVAPVAVVTELPTKAPQDTNPPTLVMSMDMSVDLGGLLADDDVMSMNLRKPKTSKSGKKADKLIKSDKSAKFGKKSKKTSKTDKLGKSEKSAKTVKAPKSEKSEETKSVKKAKEGKSEKTDKPHRRRRLRVHQVQ